ncbi:hypothetical protein [Micromonospora humi]|uniref:SMODS and SLOG-associating 2TM effector domain-containing protein n=1 Tax=Micromonospora humi TaxID=745366 RepID=A0A1C5GJ17_9ACTN|nr:hypothetical protein [Micromonospora humi]SCG33763.1 hypothetical protein GA0070213_1012 [Micromonospora humi]
MPRPRRAVSLLALAAILTVVRTRLSEESRPDPRAFRRYDPPGELGRAERAYLSWAQGHIAGIVRVARARSIRHQSLALASGLSALAVPVALAVAAPAWVPAALGFLAAAGQLGQQILRDREQSLLGHQLAVRLQRVLRLFHSEWDESLSTAELRRRFRSFRDAFEATKEEYGGQILAVRGQEPPAVTVGS